MVADAFLWNLVKGFVICLFECVTICGSRSLVQTVQASIQAADPRGVKLHIIIVCTSEGHHFTVAWQVSHAQLAANRRVQELRADVIDDEALMAIPDGAAAAAGPAAGVAGQVPPA
eukprot:1347231-Prymnesium_polylepis.1